MGVYEKKMLTNLIHDTEFTLALSLQGWLPVAVVLSSFSFLLVGAVKELCQENKRSKTTNV